MHAEACQAAQEAAAASHEDKASIVTQKKFNFREDSSPRKITSKSALSSTRTKQGQRNATDQNTDKDEADKLEAMLFGQPNVKARQTEVTTSKKDKGKGRATDESDPLTSPDVPIRSLRSSLMAGQNQNVKVSSRVDASDWVDNQDTASDKRESGRRKPLSTVSKRNEPIRAPQPAGRSSPPRPANGVAYPYNSPPAGAIFLDQLPLDVQRGCEWTSSELPV